MKRILLITLSLVMALAGCTDPPTKTLKDLTDRQLIQRFSENNDAISVLQNSHDFGKEGRELVLKEFILQRMEMIIEMRRREITPTPGLPSGD